MAVCFSREDSSCSWHCPREPLAEVPRHVGTPGLTGPGLLGCTLHPRSVKDITH